MDTALKETMNSITKGEKTFDPKSFAESFRENLLNVSKKVSEIPLRNSIPTTNIKELNIPSLNVTKVPNMTSSFTFWSVFKIILAIFIISILALNVYSFVTEGVDAYSYMFNPSQKSPEKELSLNKDEKDSGEDETAVDVAVEKNAKENKKNPTELETVMENSKNNVQDSLETTVENVTVADVRRELFEGDNIVTDKNTDHGLSELTINKKNDSTDKKDDTQNNNEPDELIKID